MKVSLDGRGTASANLNAHIRRRQGLGQEAREEWHSWAGSQLAVTAPFCPHLQGHNPCPSPFTLLLASVALDITPILLLVPTLISLISKGAHFVYFLVNA